MSSSAASPHRKLLHSVNLSSFETPLSSTSTRHLTIFFPAPPFQLVYWAVQRCRMSESPCRLTASLKRSAHPASPLPLRISVSDTGVGSKLEEFLELDVLARETSVEKWDGALLITTTGINDEAIYRYRINLREEISSARFTKLATTYKNHARFSGTEVCLCLSNEDDVDDFILWLVGFFNKILMLRAPNLACELFIEQTGNAESRNVCLPQDSSDVHPSGIVSSIDQLVCGLKNYALSHGNTCDKCDTCLLNRDFLKIGTGAANNVDRRKAKGLHVEVVIVIARTASDLNCWMLNCSSTQGSQPDKYLVRKALKSALYHLKADHAGHFLSCHGQKVREYVPDLAESIAGLILSSNDKEFQDECVALLQVGSEQEVSEGAVRCSIHEKMVRIIEMNDSKEFVEDNTPYLFECEKRDEDSQLDGEDGDEDMVFDF
ncbi:hypothetical protein U9M48_026281 [Paspalum notatum var. saurae]|uniref:Type 2 DNA topoisomerase 6 subunit B-like n=1 Tax=Paspalum notatum var. saurae TaxID=547442 RepID=A0AAQ3TUY9_PASNO